jgi:hypothetical protein
MQKNVNIVANGFKKMMNNQKKQTDNQVKKDLQKLEGFGGWLAFFGLGIVAMPTYIFFTMISNLESYGGLDIFFNAIVILMYVWLNYLMVKRRKTFKKWFFGIVVGRIVLLRLALVIYSEKYLYTPEELSDVNASVFRILFYVVVWSLYLWNSKRVRNTFIN